MRGKAFQQRHLHVRKPRPAQVAKSHLQRRKFAFESLDARTMLSATPLGCPVDDVPAATALVGRGLTSEANGPIAEPLAFNETPVGTDNAIFMSGLQYTFTPADFGFSDPNNAPPSNLLAVIITTLPDLGVVTYQDVAVTAGQVIQAADIVAGDLEFKVTGGEPRSYSDFTFQVQDDGGLVDGGSDVDPTPNTMTMLFDTQHVNFVHGLYLDVLDREPDVAGFEDWLDALADGATRLEISSGIWRSLEHRGIQVDGYYDLFFNRAADPAGRQNWIDLLMNGAHEENVMGAFLLTEEFTINYSSNSAFVTQAYQTLLNRAPETNGLNFWVDALNNQMTRSQVALGLINTIERHQNLVTSYYQNYLDRQPDTSGFNLWVGLLNDDIFDDRDVAEGILSSIEYANLPH